ncbi:hypothetical protein MLD38_033750 [Melastoma candidum]|uniref:Uncharacterized protein n=1 Tax=Melastoma candidum TaxID=119954 RepID=A0ACB9MBK3_9MYRT|nr:hypothetical protein MLD38_033750 [Melastoma candidum]
MSSDPTKIHPVHDPEGSPQAAAPTAPLFPRNSSKSDQPLAYPPPRPPRTFPVTHSRPPKRGRSCLCRCFCWSLCFLMLLIVAVAATAGILYLVFRPKLPKYSIDTLEITQFSLNNDMSLYATFDVNITAVNPNKRIGIYYEGGSRITVWYQDSDLCQGALPKFYQGHRNTTILNVPLTGQTQNATSLLTSIQQEQQSTGYIPLTVRVRQPVRVKLGGLKLMKVKFLVRCRLQVDNVSANNSVSIKNSSCKFRFRL